MLEMIIRKNRNELDQMRKSGMLVWQILQDLSKMVEEGVTHPGSRSCGGEDDEGRGREAGLQGLLHAGGGQQVSRSCCARR